MTRFTVLLLVVLSIPVFATPPVKVIAVPDGRTLVVNDGGRPATVRLADVGFTEAEAPAAAEYLGRLVLNQWVLVEEGGYVYRSPDALSVNGEMARHAWRGVPGFRYLGIAWPAEGTKATPARASRKEPAARKAPKPRKAPKSKQPSQVPHSLPNLPESESGVSEQ